MIPPSARVSLDFPRAPRRSTATTPSSARLAVRLLALIAITAACAGLGASRARAQAYVAEITAPDIGGMAPTGIAIDRTLTPETLYIADETHGRILKYNALTGERIAVLGSTGFGNGQFNRPYGIAIDPLTRDLYVAERGNGRVQRITNSGAFVMKWGEHNTTPNSPQGFFNEPIGIAAANDGHVYVVDKGNNRIQKFRVTQSGGAWQVEHVAMFGSTGSALGQLDRPYGIALENDGTAFWVAEAGNHRIQRFSITGDALKTVGTLGTGAGQFTLPTWIGIDASGSLYVTETNSDPQNTTLADINQQRVQRFTSTGDYDNFSWGGSYGSEPGQFRLPFCIAFGPENRAFVSDYYNQRVQIFDLAAPPPAPQPSITSSPNATGTVGQPFSYQITADKAVDSYGANGLPPGLSVDPATGLISGTPTAAGQTVATITATNASGSGSSTLTIDIDAATPTPGGWESQDIGTVAAAGSASETDGVVTLRGSGADIWERADEFRFRHQTLSGDGEIIARVASLQNTHSWAKAGVMIRETLSSSSPHVFMCLTAGSGSSLQRRPVFGGDSASTAGPWVGAPRWVRLVRSGNTFTGYISADGAAWTQVASLTVAMATSAQAGLAVTSHNDGVLCTATFDNVTLQPAASSTAPAAPSNLTATAASSTEINLAWSDHADNETGFEIERATNAVDFTRISTAGANVTSFTATALSAGTTYQFRVRAIGAGGNSAYSNTATATTDGAPVLAAPTDLTATAISSTQVQLEWTDTTTTETEFEWALSTDNTNFTWNSGLAANSTTTTVGGLTAETTYYFRVRAVEGATRSAASNTATAVTPANPPPPTAPAAPSGLAATAFSETEVRLSWTDNSTDEDEFHIEISEDNQTFSLVARPTADVTTHLVQGLRAATQYYFRVRAANAGGLSAYSATADATTPGTTPPPAGALTRVDIGAVAAAGALSESGGTYSVTGSGEDIWGTADEFCFAYTAWNGDGTLIARVTSQQDTDPWAKAGVMLRESLTPGSRHVFVAVTPRGISGMQTRATTGGTSTFTSSSANYTPNWLRLVRSGSTIHASHSPDGANWTAIGSVTLDLPTALHAGLAVTSHRDGTLGTATFDNVSVSAGATSPPDSAPADPTGLTAVVNPDNHVALQWTDNSTNETAFQVERSTDGGTYALVANPEANSSGYIDTSVAAATSYTYRVRALNGTMASGYSNTASVTTPAASPGPTWQHVDVGFVGISGSDDATGDTITVRGSGADIWGSADGFRFLYQVLPGDCQIEAKITAIDPTHSWAKAGVMIRESLAPGARNVFMCATSANGLNAQVRTATDGTTASTRGPWGAAVPHWVRLVRTGNTIVAAISPDGVVWSTVSTVTMPFAGDVYVGFAVTSHDNTKLNTSTFAEPAIR